MKKVINRDGFYKTRDFEEAFILSAAKCVLLDVEWSEDGKFATFIFEDKFECEEVLTFHRARRLTLDSSNVIMAYRNIKNELFRHKRKKYE